MATCGTTYCYRKGCRCELCRAANREHHNAKRAKRRARLAEADAQGLIVHGKPTTYSNWGCRCELCSVAHKSAMARQQSNRIARAMQGADDVPHGMSGYTGWGCRCEVCKEAQTEKSRRRALKAGRDFRPGIPGPAPSSFNHGTTGRYWQGCTCGQCHRAFRDWKLPYERQPRSRRKVREHKRAANEESLASARNRWKVWTGPELEVASRRDLTAREVARLIGRTVYAVEQKRRALKIDPQAIALAGVTIDKRR